MNYIAIDPGKTGAIAWWDGESVNVRKMGDTVTDIAEILRDMMANSVAWLELVHSIRITSYNVCYTKLLRLHHHTGGGMTFNEIFYVIESWKVRTVMDHRPQHHNRGGGKQHWRPLR